MRALSNISNPKYTLLVKWWGHPSSIVDKYMYNNIGNTLKFHYYYTNCWIDMMELYDQLHSIHNRPTKHESNRTNNTRGVVFTRYNYNANAWKRESPITSTEIIESKWRDNMINYTSWLITLQTSRNEWTDKPQNYLPPYYHMRDINIQIYTNGNQPGDAFNMAMRHLCNLAIY